MQSTAEKREPEIREPLLLPHENSDVGRMQLVAGLTVFSVVTIVAALIALAWILAVGV